MTIILSILLVALSVAYYFTFKPFITQRIAVRNFLKHYNPQVDIVPELLPIGKYAGKEWFVFKNPLELPAKRSEMIEMFSQWADLNMTPEFARKQLLSIKALLNKGDNAGALYVIQDIIARTELAAHESIMIDLACSLVLVEGENPRIPEGKFFEMKKNLIQGDEQTKAFFLTYAFRSIKKYEALSEADFLTYLKKQDIAEKLNTKSSPLATQSFQSQTKSKPQRPSLRTSLSQSKSSSKG
jgi:hypothetical protein